MCIVHIKLNLFSKSISREHPSYVLLGVHDLSKDKNDHRLLAEVAEIIIHPEYESSANYFDIALVRLLNRISFIPQIRPACLPEGYSTNTVRAFATGWSHTNHYESNSHLMKRIILELLAADKCTMQGISHEQQLCAGSDTKDSCEVN